MKTKIDAMKMVHFANSSFAREIALIAMVFAPQMQAFCDEYRLNFIAGNGDWWFWFTEESSVETIQWLKKDNRYSNTVDEDEIPKELLDIMHVEVGNLDLGCYMERYTTATTATRDQVLEAWQSELV